MGRSDPTSRDRLHSFAHSPRLWSPSGGESVQVKWAATSVNLTLMLESALLLLLTMHSWPRPRLTAAHIVSAQCQPHRPSSCPPQSPAGFIVSSNCSTRWYVSFCASGLPSLPSASFPHVVSCSREPDRFPALLAPPTINLTAALCDAPPAATGSPGKQGAGLPLQTTARPCRLSPCFQSCPHGHRDCPSRSLPLLASREMMLTGGGRTPQSRSQL